MSVRLSVRHTPVLCVNGYTYPPHHSGFFVPNGMAILRRRPPNGVVKCKGGHEKIRIFDKYLTLSWKWCKIEPQLLQKEGNRIQAFEWYQFEWPSVTSNPDFKVMIIRQITRKWYNIELYLQWSTNRKSYRLSNGAIFYDLERPLPPVSRSRHSLTLNISEYRHNFNGILIQTYTRPTQQCHFEWPWVT